MRESSSKFQSLKSRIAAAKNISSPSSLQRESIPHVELEHIPVPEGKKDNPLNQVETPVHPTHPNLTIQVNEAIGE